MDEGNTWVNALIGAAVTVLGTGPLPVAPLFGGAIAAYLEGGSRSDGISIGLVSGLIAFVPTVLFGMVLGAVGGLLGFGLFPGPFDVLSGAVALVALVVGLVLGAVYIVGLSVAGGWVGNYIKYDTDIGS